MIAAALLAMLAPPAQAQDPRVLAPRVLPQHDVSVAYTVSGAAATAIPSVMANQPGPPGAIRLSWDAAGQRLRAEAEGRGQVALVDLPGHRTTVLDDSLHAALVLPMRETDVQALTMANARFIRRGRETVAGEACTDYAVTARRSAGSVCLTDDGIPLRGEGDVDGKHGAFIATSVVRAAADPAQFTVPPGYNRLEMPRFGR